MIMPNVWQMEYMLKHTIFSPISNNVDMESVLFLVFLEHKQLNKISESQNTQFQGRNR
jgi:phosphoribosyl-AMP cyclohydrolase